ncbi:hypothetical protein G8A07_20400 [Roseateles sp. DAIF2]|uniref:hypothetical protein n=1 Tax=Roseateles sp. DAIF2 TaxID=2714952 RepID=UPI0018A2BD88|nr:hypothetical protein [Roseateles sp. DAIF2]QPF75043.1 hypothetical protein G8A07_20400 [Roseateles sp. DAIF2]
MTKGWTPERRAKQAALIRTWQPWTHSTGPRSLEGKARAARNGDKGGQWKAEREALREFRQQVSGLLKQQKELLRRMAS